MWTATPASSCLDAADLHLVWQRLLLGHVIMASEQHSLAYANLGQLLVLLVASTWIFLYLDN